MFLKLNFIQKSFYLSICTINQIHSCIFARNCFFFALAHVAMRKSVVLRQTEHIRLNEMSSFSTKDCVIHGLSDSMFSPIERTYGSISCENHVYILK